MFESLSPAELAALSPPDLLVYTANARRAQHEAEAAILAAAAAWAHAHSEVEPTLSVLPGIERLITIAGEGTPQVADLAVAEFAADLGLSSGSARLLIADALDLTHRLPALSARVRAGDVPVWKARRVADKTRHLTLAVVTGLDELIAACASGLPMSRLDRVVRSAIIDAQPADERTAGQVAAESRGVWVGEHGEDGNTEIFIRTDTASAVRFEAIADAIAHRLCDEDGDLTRDQRRALAVGMLGDTEQTTPATLYIHVDQATLTGDAHVARIEGVGPLVAEQVREWLQRCDVTVKPVINLDAQVPVDNWETPLRLREATFLRNPVDSFPYATSTSRAMDLDHTVPYDPGGPPGQTRLDNLAPLTRFHHRVKTHGGWQVVQPFTGVLVWRSPHGSHYLVDHTGTHRALAA